MLHIPALQLTTLEHHTIIIRRNWQLSLTWTGQGHGFFVKEDTINPQFILNSRSNLLIHLQFNKPHLGNM